MLRKGLMCVVVALWVGATMAAAQEAQNQRQRRGRGRAAANRQSGWALAVQTYTWNRVTFFESIDRAKDVGVKVVEGFAWQKLSPDTGDAKLNADAPPEALAKTKAKLQEAGVRLANYYVSDWGKDEAAHRKIFEFAKSMGIRTFVSEPDAKLLDALEPLAREFRIRIAIHNHPKSPKKPEYTYWKPENVMKLLEGRNRQIGICADTGHWVRSGLDPVECLKACQGRILCLHLKDVNEKVPEGHDVPFGTGISNVKGQLEELARQNFNGVIAIEYEHNMDNNIADVKKCVDFFNKTAQELKAKVASR